MSTSNPLPTQEEELASPLKENHANPADAPPSENRPFVMTSRGGGSGEKDKTTRMMLVAGAILVLLIAFFGLISKKGTMKKLGGADRTGKPNLGRVISPSAPGQLIPADKLAAQPNTDSATRALDAHDIEKTKSPADMKRGIAGTNGKKTLGDVSQFQQPNTGAEHLKNWSPEPYPGAAQGNNEKQTQIGGQEEAQYAKPSLVFVAHQTSGTEKGGFRLPAAVDNFGLESGYHVAARLESMASTALHAPVTAVIEYNYERDGKLLIPAGARAIGKISEADASGIMNIVFNSIEMPDGETLPISAIGATTSLQAIKGRVTGKNAGRSFAVRSLAGLGEAGAMLVGQGNVNGAVSESDLIRQRGAENIGSSADSQVMGLMLTQHIVVSVPAGTEIYLIFTKPQKVSLTTAQTVSVAENTQ